MNNEEAVMHEYISGAKSGAEIAETLGIGRNRVWDVLKKHGISERDFAERNKAHPDSWEQEEVLIGTIIGDGCLFRSSKGSKRRLSLAHSLAQKEYFMAKYNALESLVQSPWFYQSQSDKRTGKSYNCIKFQSRANLLYDELYAEWYRDGKKVIPQSILLRGGLCLAVKFFDDGYRVRNTFAFAMNGYGEESTNNFRQWLSCKFGIDTSVHKDNTVYIKKNSAETFKGIVLPYATNDVLYKLGELLGTPEAGNQQPSRTNTDQVVRKVQRLTGEDGNQ